MKIPCPSSRSALRIIDTLCTLLKSLQLRQGFSLPPLFQSLPLKKSLNASEWILSLSLLIILASLLTITHFHEHRKKIQLTTLLSETASPVAIVISGEVAQP